MNWIRKTVLFILLLISGFFAYQAACLPMQTIETKKSDTNLTMDITDSSAFIQPQTNFQLTAGIKTDYPVVIKWFDSLLTAVPERKAVKSAFNFTRQFSTQSKKISLMLYAFHFFW